MQFDKIIEFFCEEKLSALPRSDNQSQTPVFIVGMPRSGTTLVEQILDSHSQVFGAGELTLTENTDVALCTRTGQRKNYPLYLSDTTQQMLNDAANRHLEKLKALAPDAARVLDKMPHNFRYLGLIELLFPRARVIQCARDPLDTCLSIYSHDFNGMHGYSTDLAWLGQYFLEYQALMDHWIQVLTIPILVVNYEDIVVDQERMTRKLVEFCGLPWEEQCLHFYRNKRSVNTFSYDQVRRPIYNKSVARWRHYEGYLGPLKRALGIEG